MSEMILKVEEANILHIRTQTRSKQMALSDETQHSGLIRH